MTTLPCSGWLDGSAGVPLDRPFTRREARRLGLDDRRVTSSDSAGLLARPLRGIYYASQLVDNHSLRLACLRLVVPADAVVTDRSAAWLHGAPMVLAPGAHLRAPPVSMFQPPGRRLRNRCAASGERQLSGRDVEDLGGVRVTTALRTACDLGRLLHRDQALAALDALLRTGAFAHEELRREVDRFRGYRGVVQLRVLAPPADRRAKSPGESILRLRWWDSGGLPPPVPQLEVPGRTGSYFLDLGAPTIRYAAEYDGATWHGPDQREHDERRRRWVRDDLGYVVDVLTAADLHGPQGDAYGVLRRGADRARRRHDNKRRVSGG